MCLCNCNRPTPSLRIGSIILKLAGRFSPEDLGIEWVSDKRGCLKSAETCKAWKATKVLPYVFNPTSILPNITHTSAKRSFLIATCIQQHRKV